MKSLRIILIGILCMAYSRSYSQSFEWNGVAFFDNAIANQVAYIDFGESSLWGNVEITLTSSYSHQNATGLYRRSYNIGYNPVNLYSNTSEVTSALGPVAEQWKLGDFEINSSNHLVIPIYHLVSTQNRVSIHIKGVASAVINTSLFSVIDPVVIINTKTRDYNYINGKLSVGTEKADTDALLTVAGNINSRELKVKVNAGADFVFDKDYKVPDLKAVEQFIEANKHLPEVQSAQQMKESGLLVGDFQIKLLQKIEELTLYLIDQNKAMEIQNSKLVSQQALLEKQQQEIKELKSKIK